MLKKLPKSKVEFKISLAWNEWKKFLEQAVADFSAEIKIPGFRPGKAPRNLVEQKVGKNALLNQAAEKAIQKSYRDFVLKEKIEVLESPEVKIEKIEEGKDLEYTVTVAVMPKAKLKEEYKAKIKKINIQEKGTPGPVEEKEVELGLEKLANRRAKIITVRRKAQKGDNVEIDFTVSVGEKLIEKGSSQNHPLVIGQGLFIPGFEDHLVGMGEGEDKEFELAFPSDYHEKNLAGQKGNFKVKMKLVQERQLPEINDAFARSLGNFADLEALKKSLREGLEHENQHRQEELTRGQYAEALVENLEIDLPEVLIEKETEKMTQELEAQVLSMGMELDKYLAQLKKTRVDLKKDWKTQAEKRVKTFLALKEAVLAEKIQAESQEIEEEINKTLQYYKNLREAEKKIDMQQLYDYTKNIVENKKLFDYFKRL